MIKIGDLGSSLRLDAFGVDSASYIQRCTITYQYSAPEMLLAGICKLTNSDLGADISSIGMVVLELCGTQHPLHPFQTSGMQDMHNARPNQLVPYNPSWPIPEDLQEVLDMCLS